MWTRIETARRAALAATLFLVTAASCSSGDEEGPVEGFSLRGADFTGYVRESVEVGVGVLEAFPRVAEVLMQAIDLVEDGAPMPGKSDGAATIPVVREAANIALGRLGICSSGAARVIWDDLDDDEQLSSGDQLRIRFEDCDLDAEGVDGSTVVNGTLRVFVDTVGDADLTAGLIVDVRVDSTVGGAVETDRIGGSFRVEATRIDEGSVRLVFRADVGELLNALLDGDGYDFACFTVTVVIDTREGGGFTLASDGMVHSLVENDVMSITTIGPPLAFVEDEDGYVYPESGGVSFLSIARIVPCEQLDIGPEGIRPGPSNIELGANDDGTVTLRLIEDGTERVLETIRLPWSEL